MKIADRPIAKASRGMRRMVAGFASLLIVAMAVIPVFSAARPAYAVDLACEVTGSFNNIGPDTPGGGVEGLLPRVMLWKKDPKYVIDGQASLSDVPPPASNYTLWELDGTNGLDWSTSGKDVNNDDSCSVWNTTLSQVAQIIFEVPRFVVSVTNSLQEMVSTSRPVTPLLDRLDGGHTKNQGVVAQVFRWVTLPGAAIALVATGIWIMLRAGRRRRDGAQSYDREIVDGILWAVLATGVVLFLLIGNTWRTYLDAGDRAVGEFNSAVDSALLPNIGATGPCSLPSRSSSTVYNRGQRVAICNFYRTFAFDPWARGQFGSAGGHAIVAPCLGNPKLSNQSLANNYKSYRGTRRADIRVFQVEGQSYNLNDWRRVQSGDDAAQKYPPSSNSSHYSPWADVQTHMQGKNNCSIAHFGSLTASDVKTEKLLKASYGDWQGNNGFQRIGIALSDALLCLLCALPPLLASMLAFMFQILAWLAIFALPIVGVAGIFPPFRKWLTSLLQILLASYFARFAFGVALTMTELAYGIVFSSPFPFGVQILILLVIVVAAIHLIRAVREAGLTTSWSRAMHGSAVGMAGRAGRQAGRVGGAVLAGAAGGTVVAAEERHERRTRRNTVDQPAPRQDEQLRPSKPREGDGPKVAGRRRAVIAADGTTSEVDEPAAKERPPGGPQVARRLRRIEPEDSEPVANGRAPVRTGGGSADQPASNPPPSSGQSSRASSGSRVIDQTGRVVEHAEIRRRQDVVRGSTETPPAAEPEAPTQRSRRQEDRTRFVDPEL